MKKLFIVVIFIVLAVNAAVAQGIIKRETTVKEEPKKETVVEKKQEEKKQNKNKGHKQKHVEKKQKPDTPAELTLSYGLYVGEIKNGYPHGHGRLTYTKSRQIHPYDMKERMAEAGDYVEGEFFNGFVDFGVQFDSSGNVIQSLRFGRASETLYDSK